MDSLSGIGQLPSLAMPTQPDPIHGELGVLLDDGERVQCHVCGEWYLHLGVHTNAAHGLTADAYRRRFGLMRKTKLGGPAWLAMRSAISAEHLRTVESPRRQQVRAMTTEQRRAEQAKSEWRAEHERTKTPPERIRAPLKAKYGTEQGHPDEFIRGVAALFVEELRRRGQRGVYRRLGERMGTDWSTARSRVVIAVKRGHLIWTGADREPAGHLPGEEPFDPPGSFEFMFRVLERRVQVVGDAAVPDSEVFEGERLGYWARRMKTLERRGRLAADRAARLEVLPGWRWAAR